MGVTVSRTAACTDAYRKQPMIKKEKSVYNIQAVLEQFHGHNDELGFSELCRRLKFQKNKVFRLLATLESRNFIEQNKATAGYRLGLKNLQLGQTYFKQTGLLRHARPILESLTRKSGETSYVAILRDYQIIYLDAVESDLPVRVVSRVGKMFPFYCTDVGKVIAASMDDKYLRDYFDIAETQRYTVNTASERGELTAQLRKTAELCYAVDDEELDIGVKSIAAPIRDYTKRVIGAVSVSAPSMRVTAERMDSLLIPLIKEAAEDLSTRLGYTMQSC
jgi:IclR family KDG regulon transcriptional repressor